LDSAEHNRLSVTLVDVDEGNEAEVATLTGQLRSLLLRKKLGILETIRDEANPLRLYLVRRWANAAAAAASHADPEVQAVDARLHELARVTYVVHGARPADPMRVLLEDERLGAETDRRSGFDRRVSNRGRKDGDRRSGRDRRAGPRRGHGRERRG
jgi:quinol monooxygenase YgiN